MADCNDLFQKFLAEITITKSNRENLQIGRDAIKKEIENYFSKELKVKQPQFFLQGSYALKTMVAPLNLEDEYDLDDGIYLQHLGNEINNWPTSQTVSSWIVEAVRNHAKKKPENKKNCVRVRYAEGYHIDLPIYSESNGILYLARLSESQWVPNDAKAFHKWFYEKLEITEQMRNCIKYLKAWKDFVGSDLKGIHITVLVGLNHVVVKDQDDVSLTQTVQEIIAYLKTKQAVYNPVNSSENFISDWGSNKINKNIEFLEKLQKNAEFAVKERDKKTAAKIWESTFGKRFKYSDENKIRIQPVDREIQPIGPWNF